MTDQRNPYQTAQCFSLIAVIYHEHDFVSKEESTHGYPIAHCNDEGGAVFDLSIPDEHSLLAHPKLLFGQPFTCIA